MDAGGALGALSQRFGALFSWRDHLHWSAPRQRQVSISPTRRSRRATSSLSDEAALHEERLPLYSTDPDSNSDGSHGERSLDLDDDSENQPTLRTSSSYPFGTSSQKRRRCTLLRCAMFFLLLCLAIGVYLWHKYRLEMAMKVRWEPDPETKLFSQRPLPPAPQHINISNFELPLRTQGRNIVDANGHRFKLASVNWYGASDELFVVGGLNVTHRDTIAQSIKNLGFNSVRLPYADELVTANPKVDPNLLTMNPDLVGMSALDIFHAVVKSLTGAGLAVIVNNHITAAIWCCGADPCDAGWQNDHLGPICRVKQTEEEWIQNWETIMRPHIDNPLVIGADLRNEVRGLWGTMPWWLWAEAAEKAGNRLLKMKSDWLIVVEGTESANDVSGARERPVKLDVDNRLVYSAHVYGWSGWGSLDGRFVQRSYPSFVKTMRWNWGYLLEQNIAPVWIGEFGASHSPSKGSQNYWANLMRYLKSVDADFAYWALNPRKARKNENESYAMLRDDYVTPVVDYRLKDMRELMAQ